MKRLYLDRIYDAAKKKQYNEVRRILNLHLFSYREAQMFCEQFKNDIEAGKYILNQATCKCGGIVPNWEYNKTPLCGMCGFKKSVADKIEFGKMKHKAYHD